VGEPQPQKKGSKRRKLVFLLGLLGVGLAALGGRTYQAERRFAAQSPPPGVLVPAGGFNLHAIDRGKGGPPVLLIHGNPGSSMDFADTVLDRLAKERRTVAVDRPGHGWSERPSVVMTPSQQAAAVHAAAQHLKLEKPVVVGFSYGGPVALAYAIDHPKEVGALVLIASLGDPDGGHISDPIQKVMPTPVVGPLIAWTVGPLVAPGKIEAGVTDAFKPDTAPTAVIEKEKRLWSRPRPLLASAGDWSGLDSTFHGLAARYKEVRVPVEVLASKDDPVCSMQHLEYLKKNLPDANLVVVAGHGHFVMYAAPDAVVAAIERAVDEAD